MKKEDLPRCGEGDKKKPVIDPITKFDSEFYDEIEEARVVACVNVISGLDYNDGEVTCAAMLAMWRVDKKRKAQMCITGWL